MKRWYLRYEMALILAVICLTLLLPAGEALASEGNGDWRATYDLVMRWVNFGILAFLLIKFSREPLQDFLKGRKHELAIEIKRVEEQKKEASDQVKQAERQLEESSVKLALVKQRMISQGVNIKERIIEEARQQGRNIMEESQRKISSQILKARQTFRSELVDAAIDRALEKLPKLISDADKERMVKDFLSHLSAK